LEAGASFTLGLADELYGELKNQLSNPIHFGMSQPDDLAAACALASNDQVILTRPSFTRHRTVMYASSNSRRPQFNESSPASFSSASPTRPTLPPLLPDFPLSIGFRQCQQPQTSTTIWKWKPTTTSSSSFTQQTTLQLLRKIKSQRGQVFSEGKSQ
jgi:hypothetical protein